MPRKTKHAAAKAKRRPRKTTTAARGVDRSERKVDAGLIERTIDLLAEHERTVGRSVRRVGAFLIDEYFEGDVALARSNHPFKTKSYARLVEIAALETTWDAADFRRAVIAEVVARSLPRAVAEALEPTYLERLNAVDDPARRVEVASRIARGEVRGEEAKALIARESGDNPHGGRARMAGPRKAVGLLERVVERAREAGDLSAREIGRVPERDRAELVRRVREIVEALERLANALR